MAEAQEPNIKYYFKEDTNQIVVSGSTNKVGMNNLINTPKMPTPPVGGVYLSKISALGLNSSYVVQNGNDTTEIPLRPDQELWVYRGFNAGQGGDGPTYRYNPHLHRPYKAYIVTETGSGIPAFPWLPEGYPINTNADNGNVGQDIPGVFLEKQLDIIGNTNATINVQRVSGSFSVENDSRGIHPWVYTKYNTLSSPPAYGAQFFLYQENFDYNFYSGWSFNTSTSDANPGSNKVALNNSDVELATAAFIATEQINDPEFTNLSSSYENGKEGGQIRFISASNYVFYDIDNIELKGTSPNQYWKVNLSEPTASLGFQLFQNNLPVSYSLNDYPRGLGGFLQSQGAFLNLLPNLSNVKLYEGTYSYTSSLFGQAGLNGTPASGSTQFGLYADYGYYAQYLIENQFTNGQDVTVYFTGSGGSFDSKFQVVPAGYRSYISALVGTISASGITAPTVLTQSNGQTFSSTCNVTITSPDTPGTTPSNIFATRVSDVYISYSASLSSSLDGLYIFNQLPQNDVQVTASMFLTAWTGSDPDGAKYGTADYGTDDYGEGEAGDGPTWPTASLRIYTGSYPSRPFGVTGDFVTESMFMDENIHVNGLAITMSYLIPSQSIRIKDCLQISLAVTSSQPLKTIESSLVVSEYYLEFNTPTQSIEGDGRVPTFIENAFDNTLGLSNTPDCQPLINNVVGERTNKFIQNVDYTTGAYMPTNFQLILSGSASKATVPESYYTQLAQINPRYLGSETEASKVNSIELLKNGYGNLPVIDYLTGYFAYADQVLDPYPVVNNKVQLNLKYLINAAGDALQPILSPYTAFDVQGSWTAGDLGRLGVNQISGSSQYDSLNGLNSIYEVAKEPVGVLWSQTSADGFSQFVPLGGNPEVISNFTASFLQQSMTANGRSYSAQNKSSRSSANDVVKNITMNNVFAGASQSGYFSFSTGSRYGDAGTYGSNEASSSIISEFTPVTNPPYDASTQSNKQGYIFFTKDIVQGFGTPSSDLSDNWRIRMRTEFPTTPPFEYRTDAGGWNDSSDYNRTDVGYIKLRVYKSSSGTGGWNLVTMSQVTRPILRLFFSGGAELDLDLINIFGSNNAGFRNNNTEYHFQINPQALRSATTQLGRQIQSALYASFIFNIETNEILNGGVYYRVQADQYYNPESVDAARNYWNPVLTAAQFDSRPCPARAYSGPYINIALQGDRAASSEQDGALNAPYWVFSGSAFGGQYETRDKIQLIAENGNDAYGNGYIMGYLPYTASNNLRFPGGLEPTDTEIPQYNIEWELQVNDEIRFENSEALTYKIIEIEAPEPLENENLLTLTLDGEVDPSVNMDFFLIRRYRYSPNTVILDNLFPYGNLKVVQTQVNNNLTDAITTFSSDQDGIGEVTPEPGNGAFYTQSMSSTSSGSTSYVTTILPLTKKDNTPNGFFFPEYPTGDIELNTDEVIKDLRDKKLIE